MVDKETLMKTLRDVFDAGRSQGSDEATALDWGSSPQYTPDEAFSDFMATWNPDSLVLRQILETLPDPAPLTP